MFLVISGYSYFPHNLDFLPLHFDFITLFVLQISRFFCQVSKITTADSDHRVFISYDPRKIEYISCYLLKYCCLLFSIDLNSFLLAREMCFRQLIPLKLGSKNGYVGRENKNRGSSQHVSSISLGCMFSYGGVLSDKYHIHIYN